MTDQKKDKVLGGGALIIALLTLVWSQISDSSSDLNAAIIDNKTQIHSNVESIQSLEIQAAVNQTQHLTIIEKLDELQIMMKELDK